MKIVRGDVMHEQPIGTIFSWPVVRGRRPEDADDLYVKGETWEPGVWLAANLLANYQPDGEAGEERPRRLAVRADAMWVRNSDESDVFYVYEPDDLRPIVAALTTAIGSGEETTR